MRTPPALAALALLVCLAGCGPAPADAPRPASTLTPTGVAALAQTPEIVAARERAGIADGPVGRPGQQPVDKGLPDVTLACLGSDRTVELRALRGRPMVVNLWAQWCEPCRAEAPALRGASEKAGDKVLFLGIDYNDPRPDLAVDFAAQSRWRYPHLVDPERTTSPGLRVPGIPLTLLVDGSGVIRHRVVGGIADERELVRLIKVHLGVTL